MINTREQYDSQKPYFTREDCPFCDQDVAKTNKILFTTEHWMVVFNKYPYFDEEGVNLLAIPKKHYEFTADISPEEYADFPNVEKFIKKFYIEKELEYFSFIRESKSNKSVEHLHYHYLPGKIASRIIDGQKYLKIKKS